MKQKQMGTKSACIVKERNTTCGEGLYCFSAKRIISLILSIAILLSVSAGLDLSVFANTSGDFEYEVLDDGTAEITKYSGFAENLEIPAVIDGYKVTSIGNAFKYCESSPISVIIPNTVTSIGNEAFLCCNDMESIIIPDSVMNIGDYAFDSCGLLEVTIPSSVINIGEYAFSGNSRLKNIIVDKNNTNYSSEDGVLFNKDKTILIQYPTGNERTFYSIPDGVISFVNDPFAFCALTDIVLPESITSIDSFAFGDCSSLSSIIIPNSVTSIGTHAFVGCGSLLNITIPDSVVSIGSFAFENCYSLTSIIIPISVEFIGSFAFSECENLKNITILNKAVEISNNAIGYDNSWGTPIKIENDLIIHGYDNSTAQEYAWNNNIKFEPLDIQISFVDLQGTEYEPYTNYVAYTSVYNKFIAGTNPPYYTEFSPRTAITRAMFVAILYRMAGNPYDGANPYKSNPFSDINTNAYYYNAACWALDNGITNQITFKPNDNVTREQTARFLYAYAESKGLLGDEAYKNVSLGKYPDYSSVHSWAVEPLQWANYNDMITGTQQGYINPQGATQRIHATRILYGFGKACNIGNFE